MSNDFAIVALEMAMTHLILGTALVGFVWVVLRWRLIGPSGRANLLLFALLVLVASPLLQIPSGSADLEARTTADTLTAQPNQRALAAVELAYADRSESGAWTLSPGLVIVLLTLWGMGTAWHLLRLLAGHQRMRRIVAEAEVLPHHAVAAGSLVPAGVELRLTGDFGPAVIGMLQPKILLPRAIVDSGTDNDLRAVLLHEVSHIARGDAIGHGFQRLVQAVFWWSPVVHWMAGRLEIAREVACDVHAAGRFGDQGGYALALVDLVEQLASRKAQPWLPAVAMATSLRGLDERVDAIIAPQEKVSSASRWRRTTLLIAAASAALGAGSYVLAHQPRLAVYAGDTTTDVREMGAQDMAPEQEQSALPESLDRERIALAEQLQEARELRSGANRDVALTSTQEEIEPGALELTQQRQALEWEAEVRRQQQEWADEARRQQQEWADELRRQREEWQSERARQEREWNKELRRQQDEYARKIARLRQPQAAPP